MFEPLTWARMAVLYAWSRQQLDFKETIIMSWLIARMWRL